MAAVDIPVVPESMTIIGLGDTVRNKFEYEDGERAGQKQFNGVDVYGTNLLVFYGGKGYYAQVETCTPVDRYDAEAVFKPEGEVTMRILNDGEYKLRVMMFVERLTPKGVISVAAKQPAGAKG